MSNQNTATKLELMLTAFEDDVLRIAESSQMMIPIWKQQLRSLPPGLLRDAQWHCHLWLNADHRPSPMSDESYQETPLAAAACLVA
jgi:hypothetical protein